MKQRSHHSYGCNDEQVDFRMYDFNKLCINVPLTFSVSSWSTGLSSLENSCNSTFGQPSQHTFSNYVYMLAIRKKETC